MKKVICKWVAGTTAMPILGESFDSFKKNLSNREFETKYIILYNGNDYQAFCEKYSQRFIDTEIIDQNKFDQSNYPVPVRKCLWKEFPKVKLYEDSYELYIDCDIILLNPDHIINWILSPVNSLLLYKNDTDFSGYRKGPQDTKPLVDNIRYSNGMSLLNADLCAGFYGTPPNCNELNGLYLSTLKKLIKMSPSWSNPSCKGYGSDQGIFCYFIMQFVQNNQNTPLYILSYEEHPFFSVRKHWKSRWINFDTARFLHVTGGTQDWRSDHKTDRRLYKYLVKKIAHRSVKSDKSKFKTKIARYKFDIVKKNQVKGSITQPSTTILTRLLNVTYKFIYKFVQHSFILRNVLNYTFNRFETGQYEAGIYMDVYSLSDKLLFSVSLDVRDGQFNFNPRIFTKENVKIVFRHYDQLIFEKIV